MAATTTAAITPAEVAAARARLPRAFGPTRAERALRIAGWTAFAAWLAAALW